MLGLLPPGYPEWFPDPSEIDVPRIGRLALGRFIVDDRMTFVYERFIPEVIRIDGLKTFLVIPMGGVEGRLIQTSIRNKLDWEPSEFDHARYRAILRKQSLREWWMDQPNPNIARWLYTDIDGNFINLESHLPNEIGFYPVDAG